MTGLSDSFQRPINYLRIAVTDRCNLRCIYCMPRQGVPLLPSPDVLRYEELAAIARAAAALGIAKVRLTGGEPLVRLGLTSLVAMLAAIPGIDDLALTTNGMLLAPQARALKDAGLKRVNVSLDTLQEERFQAITRGGRLREVLAGLEAAREVGLAPIKVNVVVMRGLNDDEVLDFGRRTLTDGWHVRFIELMPFGAEGDRQERFMATGEVQERLQALGSLEPFLPASGNGPARYFRFPGAPGTVGFISPISEHFCSSCNRLRLTADGQLRLCLFSDAAVDLRGPVRSGASPADLQALIREAVLAKPQGHRLGQGVTCEAKAMVKIGG